MKEECIMRIDRRKMQPYFTQADKKELAQIKVSKCSDIFSNQYEHNMVLCMKKYKIKQMIRRTILYFLVVFVLSTVLYLCDNTHDPVAFKFIFGLGMFAYVFVPFSCFCDYGYQKNIIKIEKCFAITIIEINAVDLCTEGMSGDGSINTIHFYPVLGQISSGYKSIWYIPEWLYKSCKKDDIIPCWISGA